MDRRSGDGHLLLHSSGECGDRFRAPVPQPHEPQVALGLRPRQGPAQAEELGEEEQIVLGRLTLIETGLLGEDADRRPDLLVLPAEAVARDLRGPAGRRDERAQEPQGRGLARPVGPKETEDLALAHLEIEILDRGETVEALRQSISAQHHTHGVSVFRSGP